MLNAFNGSTGTVGNDFRMLQLGNNGAVTNNSAGVLSTQSGIVDGSHTGFGSYVNGNVGTTGNNNTIVHFDASTYGNTNTVSGSIFGFNMFNEHDVPDTNSVIQGININNATAGTGYRFSGMNVYNQADMDEEFRGVQITNDGDSRTATGIDVYMNANTTDDAQGLRINMTNQTTSSTTQHVRSMDVTGGLSNIFSTFLPFDNGTIDIGNNFTVSTQVASGSPLTTGVDVIQTLIQNNLQLDDTIAPGGFGLGLNGTAIINQLAFGTGVTQPTYTALLAGATVPAGSGGTLTDYQALEIVGLPSFGGSITNTNRTGIQDANTAGQDFCNGATNCWFLKVRDANAENHVGKLSINTASKTVSSNVKLEVHDGHIRNTQTTQPVATADANAGTGANCSVSGTDSHGRIDLEMGSASWASGAQCAIVFDSPYNSNPICTFSPENADAGVAPTTVQPWLATSTTDMVMFFVTADIAANEYSWTYHCVEVF